MEMSLDELMYQSESLTNMDFFDFNNELSNSNYVAPQGSSYQYKSIYDFCTPSNEDCINSPLSFTSSPPPTNVGHVPFETESCKSYNMPYGVQYGVDHQSQISSNVYSQASPSTSVAPSTLPTPPQSPPSKLEYDLESELSEIIDTFPEILDQKPHNLFPALKDVILDLEKNFFSNDSTLFSSPQESSLTQIQQQNCSTAEEKDLPKPVKKDSMWGEAAYFPSEVEDHKLKTRTISETWDDSRHQSVYSDEEYEHLPETPCVSDEDIEHFHNREISSSVSPSPTVQRVPQYVNSVSIEHNYCGKAPLSPCSQDVLSDTAPSSKTSSAQVKRQLQIVINESIKKKGKVGRPPKATKNTYIATKASLPLKNVSNDIIEPLPKVLCHGKPASYTKRMREQHCEVLKTNKNKRRKTTAQDPDDDLEKRSNHNIMERNRRVNIRNLFIELRSHVLNLDEHERASKVLILRKSKDYILQMKFINSTLECEEKSLLQQNIYFKKKLQALKNL